MALDLLTNRARLRNPTVIQIVDFILKGERVQRHGRKAYYSYVGGRQYPSKLVKEASQYLYENREYVRKVVADACKVIDEQQTDLAATGNTGSL